MINLKSIAIVLILTICFNINSQLKEYKNRISQYDWTGHTIDSEKYRLGLKIVNELNYIFGSKDINKKYKKISDGYLKSDDKEIIFDYSELYIDKIDFLVFNDIKNEILMVSKGGYLYFVEKNTPFKIKLNTLFFKASDFEYDKYSIERLISKIKYSLYNCPIIYKKEVYNYYKRYDNWWKKYFINPDDELIIFKPDIEYNLKYETLTPIGITLPSKLLPLWEKYISQLKVYKSPDFLNKLISVPNFYEVWKERHENWLDKPVELKVETKKLIEETKNDRLKLLTDFDKRNIYNLTKKSFINIDNDKGVLSDEEKYKIIILNRNLLEETFPEECPKKLEIKFVPETKFGDFDNSMSKECAGILINKNVVSRIIIERNEEVNKIGNYISRHNDVFLQKHYFNEHIKKLFSKADVITASIECNSKLLFDNKNYIVVNGDYSNTLNTDFVDYYDNYGEIKHSIKLKYYYKSLRDYFEENKKDIVFDEIYKKTLDMAFKLSKYIDSKLFHINKNYNFSDYESVVMILIELQYNYLKERSGKINFESENWEIPISFIRYDENSFYDYFLDYSTE